MPSKFTSSLSEQAVIEAGKLKYSPMAGSKHNTRSYDDYILKNQNKKQEVKKKVGATTKNAFTLPYKPPTQVLTANRINIWSHQNEEQACCPEKVEVSRKSVVYPLSSFKLKKNVTPNNDSILNLIQGATWWILSWPWGMDSSPHSWPSYSDPHSSQAVPCEGGTHWKEKKPLWSTNPQCMACHLASPPWYKTKEHRRSTVEATCLPWSCQHPHLEPWTFYQQSRRNFKGLKTSLKIITWNCEGPNIFPLKILIWNPCLP